MRFSLNRLPTPIGDLLIVFDEEERLRALDWEDYEDRMRRLLRLQYRAEVSLQAGGAPKRIRDALQLYFAGNHAALDSIPVETGGTQFQRKLWTALRSIPSGQTSTYGALATKIGYRKQCAPLVRQTAPIRSASFCRVTASSDRTNASPAMAAA